LAPNDWSRKSNAAAALPLNDSVQALLNEAGKFCAGAPFADDVCVIVAELT
jgi:hypothetical protein